MLTAIITGVAGQDGSYLSELLLSKNYNVIGVTRRKSVDPNIDNIKHLLSLPNFKLVYGDITDPTFIYRILHDYKPHEFYNLAAYSNVGQSFKEPTATFRVNAESVIMHLEAINQTSPATRYYQAGTSEQFGGLNCPEDGYTEDMQFNPRSPYAVSKVAAYYSVRNYRTAYDLYAVNGILHNHSSVRRGHDFATRKITSGVAAVKLGLQRTVKMGDLSSFRDEGSSKDYVKAMWKMLQQNNPEDFLIATGTGATIKEMFSFVCDLAGLSMNNVYEVDPQFLRPSDVPFLKGNYAKAKEKLNWEPEISWQDLLKEMYLNDMRILKGV